MTRSDLRQLITDGENSSVEFKRDDLRLRPLAKELVAFANFDGGQVVLGVDDDGTVSGLQRAPSEVEEWVMNVARDKKMEAVREALVNALVHRDYLRDATDIEFSLYEDRIEVISPGRLLNTITPEQMRTGTRAARNQLLKDIMSDYDYMEHRGLGVPRKIVKLMKEQNDTEPDLIEEEDRFLVRLWKEPGAVRDL